MPEFLREVPGRLFLAAALLPLAAFLLVCFALPLAWMFSA